MAENEELENEEQEDKEEEVVPKKKVVYIEIDDEVTDVYDKIKKVYGKHIYIVVPRNAILFQSIVNLKILKRKSEDEKKTIYFITSDKNGVYLATQVGIPVYDKVNAGNKPSLFSSEVEDDKLRITPLKASVNSVEEDAPTRLKEKKLSISEILRKKRGKSAFDVTKMETAAVQKPKALKKKKSGSRLVMSTPNRGALMGLVATASVVFLAIVYIALPGATVYLTPAASVLEKSVNITLADSLQNRAELETQPRHMIASFPIEIEVEKTLKHFATGKKFSERGRNASGKINIINTTNAAWPLVAQTRFQNEEGLVFRIADSVTVPAATADGFGQLEVFVTADPVDAFGAVVGERGNIGPSSFVLPGLREASQSKVYAESSEPMTGGITDFITFVTEEDLVAAEARLRDELVKVAADELKIAIAARGVEEGNEDKYLLLEGDNAIQIGESQVAEIGDFAGQNLAEFDVRGKVGVEGVYYEREAMLAILRQELLLKKSPQKELISINEDSTTYRVFEWDDAAGKVKMTANIKGIEQFTIDEEKENGARLIKKIRERIVGKDVENAKLFIQNLQEVNKVEIRSWPFWSPTLPNLSDNIEFEVLEAITAT